MVSEHVYRYALCHQGGFAVINQNCSIPCVVHRKIDLSCWACAVQKDMHWTDAFVARLNDEVKLTGSTISCEAPLIGGNSSSERRDNPHVQSYIMATDKV